MRIFPIALLALAACVPEMDVASKQMLTEATCGAEKLQHLVDLPFEARDYETEGRPLRILPPGSMVTMDHRPDRLNVDISDDGDVIRIWCG